MDLAGEQGTDRIITQPLRREVQDPGGGIQGRGHLGRVWRLLLSGKQPRVTIPSPTIPSPTWALRAAAHSSQNSEADTGITPIYRWGS